MSNAMPSFVPTNGAVEGVRTKRFGMIAARIGYTHQHRLGIAVGRNAAGSVVHLTVKDISRHRAEAAVAKWICANPNCAGKSWASKGDMLEAHPDNRILVQQGETHCYVAVADVPAVPARAARTDKDGKVIEPARDEQPAAVLLLSDEE